MHRVRWGRHKSFDLPKLSEDIIMTCHLHGQLKEHQTYYYEKQDYYQCIECKKRRSNKFAKNNPDRIQTRNFIHLGKKGSGIRLLISEYEKIHQKQNGLCAICDKPETMKSSHPDKTPVKRLAVDHCHITGKIRGLLCHHCNTGLGHFKDDILLMQKAMNYLKENN
jgi:hypothetical protein